MSVRRHLYLLPLLLVGGCGSTPDPAPLPTLPIPSEPIALREPEPPKPPEVLPLGPLAEKPDRATISATSEGLVMPRREWFRGVAYEPPYHPNHSYLLYSAEGRMTKVELQPGEKPNGLMASVCSDSGVMLSTAWTAKGAGSDKTWTFNIKSKFTGPDQDCDISTDRGSYHVVVRTTQHTHHQLVRFSDPYRFLSDGDPHAADLCAGTDRAYTLGGDVGAFGLDAAAISNDGQHTCIRMPPNVGYDLPAVWIGEGETARPASPSLIDGALMIDGVPRVMELRAENITLRIERVAK